MARNEAIAREKQYKRRDNTREETMRKKKPDEKSKKNDRE